MRRATLRIVLSAVVVALAGCESNLPAPPPSLKLEALDLQCYWQINVTLEEGESLTRLVLVDQTLYGMTDRARLMSIDAARGVWQWTVVAGGPTQRLFTPIHADSVALPTWLGDREKDKPSAERIRQAKPFNATLFNTLSHILVVNRDTGDLVMKIPLNFVVSTSGTAAPDGAGGCMYYLASPRGWCYGVDLRRGMSVWTISGKGAIRSAPVFYKGVLYLADQSGLLQAISMEPNGTKPLWHNAQIDSQRMAGAVTAGMYIDDRGCFVACEDNRLYAYDRLTGKPLWPPFIGQGPLRDAPQVGENTIFQRATQDQFYAIDVANGSKRWALPEGQKVLAVVRDKGSQVYLLDQANTLRVIEEITGVQTASQPMTGYEVYAPNVTIPAIFAASRSGKVVCLRPRGAGVLTSEELKAKR
jgi:outer membrane protein assembly factor BamB